MDDLAQEAFLTAFRRLSSFKEELPFRAWVLGIARLHALKYLRDRQQTLARQQGLLEAAVSTWRAQEVDRQGHGDLKDPELELRLLKDCIQGLSPSSLQIVRQFYFNGRALSEVAHSVGKREGAMKMTLLRIREALRECVEGKLRASEAAS